MFKFPFCSLKPAFESYLPKEVVSAYKFTETELVTDYTSIPITQCYGTSKELTLEVAKYFNIPGSFSKFGIELTCPYITKPEIYKSFKKIEYIYKQDIFVRLLYLVPYHPLGIEESHMIHSIISFFLRTKENQKMSELVQFESNKLAVLGQTLAMKLLIASSRSSVKLPKPTLVDVFTKIKKILPANEQDPEFLSILRRLEDFDSKHPVKKNVKIYEEILKWIDIIIEEFTKFIEQNPKWFLPKLECTQDPKDPILIRVFDDNIQKIVMEYELLGLLDELDAEETNDIFETTGLMKTIGFREAFTRLGEKVKNIEFVIIPVYKSKHAAAFIPSFDGNYCILASDLFLEILRYITSVKGVFQKINQDNSGIIEFLFNNLGHIFYRDDHPGPLFFDTEKANSIRENVSEFLKTTENFLEDSKNVRKVGPNGFTPADLRNEIHYLGLNITFPNILHYADKMYEVFVLTKKVNELRTCHMYDILEQCQIICLFGRLPQLLEFFHGQGTCGQFNIQCMFCLTQSETNKGSTNPGKKSDGDSKGANSVAPKASVPKVNGKSADSKLEKQEKGKEEAQVETTEEKAEEVSLDSAEMEKMNKKKEKKRKAVEKKKLERANSEASETAPEEEESKVCEKCFGTSELCNSANEKLRLERIKTKALQEELAKVTQRDFKKGEVIQMLREKLASLKALESTSTKHESTMNVEKSERPTTSTHTDEIVDEECNICHLYMELSEILECRGCKYRCHIECALDLSNVKNKCPVCKIEIFLK